MSPLGLRIISRIDRYKLSFFETIYTKKGAERTQVTDGFSVYIGYLAVGAVEAADPPQKKLSAILLKLRRHLLLLLLKGESPLRPHNMFTHGLSRFVRFAGANGAIDSAM